MTENAGFSIQKYVGVTPAQLAKLHEALTTEPICRPGYIEGEGSYRKCFAELRTVSWNLQHRSLTIEVIVYDYAIWRRSVGSERQWATHCEHSPTERWVVENILDALERFPIETE